MTQTNQEHLDAWIEGYVQACRDCGVRISKARAKQEYFRHH